MKTIKILTMMILLGVMALPAKAQERNVHSFTMTNIDGQDIKLADYEGKTLLIVNTASKCGFTKQYTGMQQLYDKYKNQGFEVLAFPANDFLGQEPGSNEQIKQFCNLEFQTTFPLFAKTSVKGKDINPLYRYLTQESAFKGDITWNFNKFLIAPNGEVVARFDKAVDPMSPEVTSAVEQFLDLGSGEGS